MDYHLADKGQEVGVFPLDELRRRRQTGQLSGIELVWCQGMSDWQPLDEVLRQTATNTRPTTPPLLSSTSPRTSNRTLIWIAVGIGIFVFVTGIVVVGLVATSVARRYLHGEILTRERRSEDVSSKPVSWSTNSLTEAILQQRRKEFRVRQWIEGYEKRGQRDKPCDAEVLQFLNIWIDRNFGGDPATNLLSTAKWSDKLAADPECTDPAVLTVTAVNSIELHEQARRMDLALRGFEHSQHLAYPKLVATVVLANSLVDLREQHDRVAGLDASAINLLKQAFADGSLLPQDQVEISEIMLSGWGEHFFARKGYAVCSAVRQQGKPYEWLTLILEGQYQVNEAWKARGNGYADTVTKEGWKGFYEHLSKARKSFTKAWPLRPDLPTAATCMMNVSLGQSGAEEMRLWFDRAIAAQIDEPHAWRIMRWGLRPRWYGSHDAMLALGVTALNTHRFDTDVPRKFFDVVEDLESELKTPPGEHIYGREDIWPHFQEMYEGYLASATNAAQLTNWHTGYADAAYLAGKYDVARTQLEALNWPHSMKNQAWCGTDMSLMPLEVAARTGPAGAQVADAESHSTAGDVVETLRRYRDLASATNLDERTTEFVQRRIDSLEIEKRLAEGQWVDFLPTRDDDPNWTNARGKYRHLADGSVEVESGPDGHSLAPHVRIGPEFEVKGEFEIVRSSNNSFQAGLAMGTLVSDYDWYSFRMKRNDAEGQLVTFAMGWTKDQVAHAVTLDDKHNSFYFRFHHGKASISLNGQNVISDAAPPRVIRSSDQGFGLSLAAFNDANDTVIRYRNVQVRRLVTETNVAN